MKITTKKIIAFILLICFIAVAIYMCGDKDDDTSPLIADQTSLTNTNSNISDSSFVFSDMSDLSENESDSSWDSTHVESNIDSETSSVPDESDFESSVPDMSFPVDSDISDNETSSETPSDPAHSCSFVKGVTVTPTCTVKGYTVYTCSCGKSEKRNEVAALGHIAGDWETVKEATTTSTGLEQKKCTRNGCGVVIEERTTDKLPSDEDKYNVPATAANAKLVEERVLFYINEYREDEGTAKAETLTGKTYQYAKMRAEQIVDNYAHDREDMIEVCNKLKFGQYHGAYSNSYIDASGKTIYTGELCEPYYYGGCSEAIAGSFGTSPSWTVDLLAKKVAATIHNSSGHWSYVGAATTEYISVGSFSRGADGYFSWYFCIATSSTNKYD